MNIERELSLAKIPEKSDKEASAILKGIAILTVLINHYISYYTDLKIGGFANTVVAVFFFLSGYGIFCSFENKFRGQLLSGKNILIFYISRVVRIFPLFWLALYIQSQITATDYHNLSFFGIEAEGHYWFISAILQCYIFTPILYIFIKRNKHIALLSITFLFGISVLFTKNNSIDASFLASFHLMAKPYLEIYFLHTYLFFLGMCTQSFGLTSVSRNQLQQDSSHKWHYINFTSIILATFVYIYLEKYVLDLPLVLGIVLLLASCIYGLKNRIPQTILPFKVLGFLGHHSFSIYLFHMSYYFLLGRTKLLDNQEINSFIVIVVMFPCFLLMCVLLEKYLQKLSKLNTKLLKKL